MTPCPEHLLPHCGMWTETRALEIWYVRAYRIPHSNPIVSFRLLFHSCCCVGSWPLWQILSESQSAPVPPTVPASLAYHKKDALIIAVWIASGSCVGCQFHKDKWGTWVDSLHETFLLQAHSELESLFQQKQEGHVIENPFHKLIAMTQLWH